MPDRARARALVAALLLVLTVAGIRAIGPPGGWGRHASHAVAVGVLLEIVLGGLFVALRWRRKPQGTLAPRINRLLSGTLTAAMIAIAIAVVLSAYNTSPENLDAHQAPRLSHRAVRIRLHIHPFRNNGVDVALLLRDALFAAVVLSIIVILIIAWLRRRPSPALDGFPDVTVDEAESDLARAVESGRAALRELDDARAAIIRCYVAMEQSLAGAGAERGVAETPDELLARAVEAGLVPRPPAERLTALFYEARYSTHPMPAAQRDEAEHALADLAAVLPVSEPT